MEQQVKRREERHQRPKFGRMLKDLELNDDAKPSSESKATKQLEADIERIQKRRQKHKIIKPIDMDELSD